MAGIKNDTPTKEIILANEVKFRLSTLRLVRQWKEEFYKGKWKEVNQNDAIKALIEMLAKNHRTSVEIHMDKGQINAYDSINKTINLDSSKPSIITALHEFAHHIQGPSETDACRWSIWLFIKTFPLAYDSLTWDKHMLVKEKL